MDELTGVALKEDSKLVKPLAPKCPWCKQCPAPLAAMPDNLGPVMVMTIFCSNPACLKIHSVAVVGMQRENPGMIVRPGVM